MSYNVKQDGGSSDEGWSDDHFSDVESSGDESEKQHSQSQRYIQLNQVKYPEKLSSSPALPPQKLSSSPALPPQKLSSFPALPPRKHIVPPPTPPIRANRSPMKLRDQDKTGSEANSRKCSNDKDTENILQAMAKLRPVTTGIDEEDGEYLTATVKRKQFSKDHNKVPENVPQLKPKLKPITTNEEDGDYVVPINDSRKCSNDKISENILQAMAKLKPVTTGIDEDDGDYVVPINKPWLQSKVSLTSPVTYKEMSQRKKLPIPKLVNASSDAESSIPLELDSFEWFHGKSSREVVKEQLLQHEMNGMYAVRKSNQKSSCHAYSLTFYHKGHIYNFPIRTRLADKKFALGFEKPDEPAFSSLQKLVTYFREYKIKLANNELAILTTPLPNFS